MSTKQYPVLFACLAVTMLGATTRAAVIVSNLGEAPGSVLGSGSTGTPPSAWLAAKFTTGNSSLSYSLAGASAHLRNDSIDNTVTFEASIWSDAGAVPGTLLGTFSSSPTLGPKVSTGILEFSGISVDLSPDTSYWLAVRSTDAPVFAFRGTASDSQTSPDGWTISDAAYAGRGGASWTDLSSLAGGEVPMFSITAVPEPGTIASCALMLLGGVAVHALQRRRRKA